MVQLWSSPLGSTVHFKEEKRNFKIQLMRCFRVVLVQLFLCLIGQREHVRDGKGNPLRPPHRIFFSTQQERFFSSEAISMSSR